MKLALLAAAAMVATPLMAQTTPAPTTPPADPSTAPAPGGQSTMTPPATTTPDASMTTPPASGSSMAGSSMGGTGSGGMTQPMATDGSSAAMAGGKLPWCRPGQYNNCREHETKGGEGVRKN